LNTLLEIKDLKTYFYLDEGVVKAVDGVSFQIERGKTLGVVGESGCGKSVTAQAILRIVPSPGKLVKGKILLYRQKAGHNGAMVEDLAALDPDGEQIRRIRGAEISMIFQEPTASFSPVHTIGHQIEEAILLHQDVSRNEARARAIEMLAQVGIPDAKRRIDEYPFRLSGGMLQRAMIAVALSCRPDLLIADEPTTALDVTIQAQILELMNRWQSQLGMSIMIITHDLGVIAEMAEQVVVMYWGRVVEQTGVDTVFHGPKHPYTAGLHQSIPKVGRRMPGRLPFIRGVVPDPFAELHGCPFHPRCPKRIVGFCDVGSAPALVEVEKGHAVACFLYHDRRASDHDCDV
jgi:oligopeptide/dipeptide ABC transporter ATP-binding protein